MSCTGTAKKIAFRCIYFYFLLDKKMDMNYTVISVFLHIERGKCLGNIRF